jgi:hypothetical protein
MTSHDLQSVPFLVELVQRQVLLLLLKCTFTFFRLYIVSLPWENGGRRDVNPPSRSDKATANIPALKKRPGHWETEPQGNVRI